MSDIVTVRNRDNITVRVSQGASFDNDARLRANAAFDHANSGGYSDQ